MAMTPNRSVILLNFSSEMVTLIFLLGMDAVIPTAWPLALLRFLAFLNRKLHSALAYLLQSPLHLLFSACFKQVNRWLVCIWDRDDSDVVLQSRAKCNV